MERALLCDLGRLGYAPAYQFQVALAERVKQAEIPHTLLFVEHDPVLTLGANFHEDNLLFSREQYRERGIDVQATDRGGDVTFHGPKQLVIYPIFDVSRLGKDLHKWLRDLEQTIIVVLEALGKEGTRFPPNTGVWVGGRKVAAIGIKISRWVSLHGIALNCDNDLEPFGLIVPCGIRDFGVTSLSKEVGRRITIEEAKPLVADAFSRVFGLAFESVAASELTIEEGHPQKTAPPAPARGGGPR